ncbi:MAG: hypothetical protein ACXWPK_11570, partial [Isosphaeraceae bacterium]
GHEDGWLLVTTNEDWSAPRVRDLYGLRTDIEERHRQVKCFWDLTRMAVPEALTRFPQSILGLLPGLG